MGAIVFRPRPTNSRCSKSGVTGTDGVWFIVVPAIKDAILGLPGGFNPATSVHLSVVVSLSGRAKMGIDWVLN